MGRRKAKPFIDKKNAEHFVLMHRSQNDPKYYEEGASKYVLMSTRARLTDPTFHSIRDGDTGEVFFFDDEDKDAVQQRLAAGGGAGGEDGGFTDAMYAAAPGSRKPKRRAEVKTLVAASVDAPNRRGIKEFSEVDDMGFPLDGYDYSQHMRPMGGGAFMSSAGQMLASGVALTHSIAAKMDIPADVLPSRTDEPLEGMVEAINLRPETLPSDILEAMEALDELDEGDELDVEDGVSVLEAIEEGEDDDEGEEDEDEEEDEEEGGGGAATAPVKAAAKAAPKAAAASGGGGAGADEAAATGGAAAEGGAAIAPASKLRKKQRAIKAADVERAGLEWLDDNFVLQAAGELPIGDEGEEDTEGGGAASGGAGGFDFQAHIARLMAAAEGKWTDTADDFDEDEWDDDDEEGEYEEDEEDEEGGGGAAAGRGYRGSAAAAASGAIGRGTGYRPDDNALAAVLAQYDDEEIGELADDDPRLRASLWGRKQVEKALGGGTEEDDDSQAAGSTGSEDEEDEDDEGAPRGKGSAARGDGSLLGSLLDEYLSQRESNRIDAMYEAGVKLTRHGRNGKFAVAGSAGDSDDGEEDDDEEEEEEERGPALRKAKAATAPAPAPASSGFAVKIGLFAPKKTAPAPAEAPAAPAPAAHPEDEGDDDEGGSEYDDEAPGELPSRAARLAARLAGLVTADALEAERQAEAEAAAADDAYVPFGFADGDFKSVVDANLLSRAPKAKPKWDAQTIVSTYTNTENHPRLVTADAVSIVSKRGGAAPTMLAGGGSLVTAGAAATLGAAPVVIRLSKKTGLPIVSKPAPAASAAGDASSSDDDSEEEEEEDLGSRPAGIVAPRQRGETAEERKARKALVKEERRARRETKKAVKTAFKEEEVKQTAAMKRRDPLAGAKHLH